MVDGYRQATFSRHLLTRQKFICEPATILRPLDYVSARLINYPARVYVPGFARLGSGKAYRLAYTCITLRRASGLESISHAVSGVNQPR